MGDDSQHASHAAVHFRKIRKDGPAKNYTCPCGKQARDWAYQHNAEVVLYEFGLPYTEDLSCYVAMCRSCHILLDSLHHPDSRGEACRKVPSEVRRRAGLSSVGTDDGNRQRHERAVLGGLALQKRRRVDPEFDQEFRANAGKAGRQRKTCLLCPYESNPGSVARHVKRVHSG